MAELAKQEKHRNRKIFNLVHAQPEKNKYTAWIHGHLLMDNVNPSWLENEIPVGHHNPKNRFWILNVTCTQTCVNLTTANKPSGQCYSKTWKYDMLSLWSLRLSQCSGLLGCNTALQYTGTSVSEKQTARTLKRNMVGFSKILLIIYRTTWRHHPQYNYAQLNQKR